MQIARENKTTSRPGHSSESLIDTAFLWRELAYSSGCRFDVEQKALDAILFTLTAGGTTLAIPSKLVGTARRSVSLEALRRAQLREPWPTLTLSLGKDDDGHDAAFAFWRQRLVGYAQPKHLPWLIPLLRTGRLSCYVLATTGGTGHRSWGCNVVYAGIRAAIDAHLLGQLHRDVREADAKPRTDSGDAPLRRIA